MDVKRINTQRLQELPGESCTYSSVDSVEVDDRVDPEDYDRAKRDLWNSTFFTVCQAAKELELKPGAQVMLVKNLSFEGGGMSLINGSRGVVSRWRTVKEVLEELITALKTTSAQPMSEEEEWKRVTIEQQINILRSYKVECILTES